MRSHVTMDELEAFRRGHLAADELTSVAAHLRQCRECGARWPAVEAAARALAADLSEGEHPEVDDLFGYVDGDLPRERADEIAEHLRDCPQCSADIADAWQERDTLRHPERSRGMTLGLAAAIAIVIGGAALWLSQRPTP